MSKDKTELEKYASDEEALKKYNIETSCQISALLLEAAEYHNEFIKCQQQIMKLQQEIIMKCNEYFYLIWHLMQVSLQLKKK